MTIAALTGCGGDVRSCTGIGAGPTITIDVSRILADQPGQSRVRVCVETTCHTSRRGGIRLGSVSVDDPAIQDSGPVDVGIWIETVSGDSVYERHASVELTRMQPNGPDCEPTFYATTLVATRQGGLEPAG